MNTVTDVYGFELSTTDAEAAAAWDAGARSFVAWQADAIEHLNAAMTRDAGFVLPALLKAWILHGARAAKFNPVVDKLLAMAEPHLADASPRERVPADSLRLAHGGQLRAGAAALEMHLAVNPADVLAHRLFQFELFWCGESRWMRDVVERAAPGCDEDMPDFAQFLAVRAFSNEEAGDYATAEHTGRDSVEREPEGAWGAHAVAHTLLMQGRADEGADWMEGLCHNWGKANQIRHHNWWHLCLFLLERGEHTRVLDLIESQVRNPESPLVKAQPDATIDLQNVASLLMRLELRGVDVGDRWRNIADLCAERIDDHDNPFSSAHDAMALTAVRRFELVDQLLDGMRAQGTTGSGLGDTTRALGVPLVEAIAAHRRRDFDRVVDLLWPVRRDLHRVGGSHAQRDIFFQILVDAAMRAGRSAQVAIILEDIAGDRFCGVAGRTLYRDAAALEPES